MLKNTIGAIKKLDNTIGAIKTLENTIMVFSNVFIAANGVI
jgi:hypothetical protein